MMCRSFFVLVAGFFWAASAQAASPQSAGFPSLMSILNVPESLDFCGEAVPLKTQDVRERLEKELLLTVWDRPQVILWLKRSRRYLPIIEKMLKESDMPEDLKYLAIAESALRPHAGSRKGAIGFWQFLAVTGRKYGLTIDRRIDERRNLNASTSAAIHYFKELRESLGSWTLAAAAFNMGEEGLQAEILEQGTDQYYELYLPLETQRFLFRILSVKMIFSDPDLFGFKLSEGDYYPPVRFDKVRIDCFQETPIRIVARAAGTRFKVIKDLNPEIRGHYLSAGSHTVLIPESASRGFHERFENLLKEFLASQKERVYVVKEGDNLSSIAERFQVPLQSLLIWNRLDLKRPIQPGDRLIIHPGPLGKDEVEGDGD